jgi:hypothetical protein
MTSLQNLTSICAAKMLCILRNLCLLRHDVFIFINPCVIYRTRVVLQRVLIRNLPFYVFSATVCNLLLLLLLFRLVCVKIYLLFMTSSFFSFF